MLPEDINEISKSLIALEQLDITEKVRIYVEKNGGDIETTHIGQISAKGFINFYEATLMGLRMMLESDIRFILSKNFYVGKSVALTNQLSNLFYRIRENDLNNAFEELRIAAMYLQMYNLLPDSSGLLKDTKKTDKISKIYAEIDLKRNVLDDIIEKKNTLLEEIQSIVSQQNKTIAELENELKEANRKNEAINELLLQSTANEQRITNLVGNFEHEFERVDKQSAETQKELRDIQNTFKKSVEEVVEFNKSTSIIAKEMHNKSADFDAQLSKLNELLGKQAASSLFSTFKVRKEELSKPVTRWMLITFGAGGFALLWVIAVFTNFFGLVASQSINIDATFLILNSLKSVPAIILLYFSIRQYVRERNMQEEYAFRSAIALTIQAYGDMVGDKKHELIMAATSTIYAMPSVMKERGFSLFRKKENGLTEIMKQLNETLKTVQSNK